MTYRHVRSAVMASMVIATLASPNAATRRPVDLPERLRGAERAVVGKIVGVHAEYVTNEFGDRLIVSRAHVRVDEVLKGGPVQDLEVDVEGGTVGELTLRVSDLPEVRQGDRAVFLLRRGPRGADVPHLRGLGILKLDGRDTVESSSLTLDMIRTMARQGVGQ